MTMTYSTQLVLRAVGNDYWLADMLEPKRSAIPGECAPTCQLESCTVCGWFVHYVDSPQHAQCRQQLETQLVAAWREYVNRLWDALLWEECLHAAAYADYTTALEARPKVLTD